MLNPDDANYTKGQILFIKIVFGLSILATVILCVLSALGEL